MKKVAAKVVSVLLAPQLRPIETRVIRYVGLAVLAWLGVKYA
jgi:threonine/homoserine/homoserine lactone efflux protein